ncbi:hypothetical protein [Mycobacterium intracellulare]|uniref:hypothetical protein n=1 Tax=Mycobacterium intracellulare TaxID=1767 RepID=UPI0018DF0E0E|nr:hypothetical protein [Mycobacterium intracellulare]MCF1814428.1 hypothetical protein [Mycobacterium intracellulare subsp. intracellulare]MDS0336260.1 hypothetical protein [Mycobacterium intracellulare]
MRTVIHVVVVHVVVPAVVHGVMGSMLHVTVVHPVVAAVIGVVLFTAQVRRLGALASIVALHVDIDQLHSGPIQCRLHRFRIGQLDANTRSRQLIPHPLDCLG